MLNDYGRSVQFNKRLVISLVSETESLNDVASDYISELERELDGSAASGEGNGGDSQDRGVEETLGPEDDLEQSVNESEATGEVDEIEP